MTEMLTHPTRDELSWAPCCTRSAIPCGSRWSVTSRCGERSCGSFDVPVTKSTCTHHFKVLREAGVIAQRQDGRARLNTLRSEDLEARFPGVLDAILGAAARA